jgi:hypothetical protein
MQPLSSIPLRSAYTLLLAAALAWGVAVILVGLLALLTGYLGPWRDLGNIVFSYWWIWLGPLLLVAGASAGLRGRYERASIFSTWIGCFSLSAMVLYLVIGELRDLADPLIPMSFGYLLFLVFGVLLALLADASAFRISWKLK